MNGANALNVRCFVEKGIQHCQWKVSEMPRPQASQQSTSNSTTDDLPVLVFQEIFWLHSSRKDNDRKVPLVEG